MTKKSFQNKNFDNKYIKWNINEFNLDESFFKNIQQNLKCF